MKNNFIFEIFSEHIPYHIQKNLITQWSDIIKSNFSKQKVNFNIYATPLRISLKINNFEIEQKHEKIKGPIADLPKNIIEKFLSNHNITLQNNCIKNNNYYKIEKHQNKEFIFIYKKANVENQLIKLCNNLFKNSIGPNKMKWNNYNLEWFRPIHNILCMLNDKILNFNIEHLTTNNKTYKLDNNFQKNEIILSHAVEYEQKLNDIMLDYNIRKIYIKNEINKYTNYIDNDLLDDVTGISENPKVLMGSFDKIFLKLPSDIIISILKEHQKYFIIKNNNRITNNFLFISNNSFQKTDNIINGNQSVLKARLKDADFFWNNDIKYNIDYYSELLNKRLFFKNLGKISDRINRMCLLVKHIYPNNIMQNKLINTIKLSKIDLCMSIVEEHPSLQGIIGYYYLKNKNYDLELCEAIKNQYYYKFNYEEKCYLSELSQSLCFIENLEKFLSFSMIGIKSKGMKDPFGLKRSLNTIINLSLMNKINLKKYLKIAYDMLSQKIEIKEKYINILNLVNERFNSITNLKVNFSLVKIFKNIEYYEYINFVKNINEIENQNLLNEIIKRIKGINISKINESCFEILNDYIKENKNINQYENIIKNIISYYKNKHYLEVVHFLKYTINDIDDFLNNNKINSLDENSLEYKIFSCIKYIVDL